MEKSLCVLVGKISRKYSFRGEVLVKFNLDIPLNVLSSFLLEVNNSLVPFSIISLKPHGKGFFRVRLEGIESEIQANQLLQKEIYFPLNLLPNSNKYITPQELIGFSILDEDLGNIGVVEDVNTSTPQILMTVSKDEDSFWIPFAQDLVIDINKKEKTILMQLPQGILDINH